MLSVTRKVDTAVHTQTGHAALHPSMLLVAKGCPAVIQEGRNHYSQCAELMSYVPFLFPSLTGLETPATELCWKRFGRWKAMEFRYFAETLYRGEAIPFILIFVKNLFPLFFPPPALSLPGVWRLTRHHFPGPLGILNIESPAGQAPLLLHPSMVFLSINGFLAPNPEVPPHFLFLTSHAHGVRKSHSSHQDFNLCMHTSSRERSVPTA